MASGLPGGKIMTSSDAKNVLVVNTKATQNQNNVTDSSLKKQKQLKKKRKSNDENSDLLTVRHLESTIDGTLTRKLKETSLVTGNNSSSPSSETQVSPKKRSKKKPKTTISSSSALPILAEEIDKKSGGEQVMQGELQSEIIDTKYRKFGAQRATEQSNLISLQQAELEAKGNRSQFNPALRWEYALDDIDTEKNRIDEYKRKRRERYYAYLGMEIPKTSDESIDDVEFVFA